MTHSIELSRLFLPGESLSARLEKNEALMLPDAPLDDPAGHFAVEQTTVNGDTCERLVLKAADTRMIFSVWARSQLLTTVGTREKWFTPVSLVDQAAELNKRMPSLKKQLARVRTIENSDVCMLRGIVSRSYAHLPDTQLFNELVETCPGLKLLRGRTVATETSLYCFLVNPKPLQLPHSDVKIFGGALVRNSEVGYTSLWVSPFHAWVYPDPEGKITRRTVRVAVEEKGSWRRAHRGHAPELRKELETALQRTPLYDIASKQLENTLKQLSQITYASEKEALERGDSLLKRAKATAAMRKLFETSYKGSPRSLHTGVSLYETILSVAAEPVRDDDAYASFAVAGAVLQLLIA